MTGKPPKSKDKQAAASRIDPKLLEILVCPLTKQTLGDVTATTAEQDGDITTGAAAEATIAPPDKPRPWRRGPIGAECDSRQASDR